MIALSLHWTAIHIVAAITGVHAAAIFVHIVFKAAGACFNHTGCDFQFRFLGDEPPSPPFRVRLTTLTPLPFARRDRLHRWRARDAPPEAAHQLRTVRAPPPPAARAAAHHLPRGAQVRHGLGPPHGHLCPIRRQRLRPRCCRPPLLCRTRLCAPRTGGVTATGAETRALTPSALSRARSASRVVRPSSRRAAGVAPEARVF